MRQTLAASIVLLLGCCLIQTAAATGAVDIRNHASLTLDYDDNVFRSFDES